MQDGGLSSIVWIGSLAAEPDCGIETEDMEPQHLGYIGRCHDGQTMIITAMRRSQAIMNSDEAKECF